MASPTPPLPTAKNILLRNDGPHRIAYHITFGQVLSRAHAVLFISDLLGLEGYTVSINALRTALTVRGDDGALARQREIFRPKMFTGTMEVVQMGARVCLFGVLPELMETLLAALRAQLPEFSVELLQPGGRDDEPKIQEYTGQLRIANWPLDAHRRLADVLQNVGIAVC